MAGAADEARVTYKAIANFLSLKKAAAAARADLEALRKQEAKTNADSVAGSKKVASGHQAATKALKDRTNATRSATTAMLAHNKALQDNVKLAKSSGDAAGAAAAKIKDAANATSSAAKESKKLASNIDVTTTAWKKIKGVTTEVKSATKGAENATSSLGSALVRARNRMIGYNAEAKKFYPISKRIQSGGNAVYNVLQKITGARSHGNISAPFIILIPVIGALLALMNPLVAILGALGAAGYAAGSSLLSVGGAAIAIVPMIAAAVAAVAGLLVAFKGIGGVFSKFGAAKKASSGGGGGGGTSAADQAYNLMKAEERLTDAQEAQKEAQDNLNDARLQAVKNLKKLQDAVNHDILDEADATAALQQALEEYNNVLADPGSTLGDKMAALANYNDAVQAVADSQQQAVDDQNDLNAAQAKGVEGSDEVVAAQKQLLQATREVRDAQHDLTKATNGGGGGGGAAGAMDEFKAALDKLSPSAKAFVLFIISMQGAWENLQRAVQESFFSQFIGDIGLLNKLLPGVQNLLTKAAAAMGRFVDNALKLITNDKWTGDLQIISNQNVKLIDLAGMAVLNLLNALKDITIAAGPFAVKLLGSFEKLTKSFSTIVSDARNTGALANWLEVVYGRLQQWWRIVKNIAGTLFNYGAASAEFGKWITDGLEQSTENWLKASERARKQGSPFKSWLEELKPLLVQIKGLFGDFFGWLSKTAHDNDAITNAANILSDIRTKLGPALSELFKALDESGAGKILVDALASIAQAIADLVKNGGGKGFAAFFTVIKDFFDFLGSAAKDPFWGPLLGNLAALAGALAGLALIGKFTGITALLNLLLSAGGSAGVAKVLAGLSGLAGGGAAVEGLAAGGAAAGGASAAGGAAGLLSSPILAAIVAAVLSQVLKAKADQATYDSTLKATGDKKLATDTRRASQTTGSAGSLGAGGIGGVDIFAKDSDDAPKKTESQKKLKDAIDKAAAAKKAQLDQDKKAVKDNEDNISSQSKMADALQKIIDKNAALKQSAIDTAAAQVAAGAALDAALAANGKHWDDGTDAANANKIAVLNYSVASQQAAEASRKNGASYDTYKAALMASRAEIERSIIAMGGTQAQAEQTAAAIVRIPTQKQFNLQNNIDATQARADAFYAAWQGKNITAFLNVSISGAAQKAIDQLNSIRIASGGKFTSLVSSTGGLATAARMSAVYRASGGGTSLRGKSGAGPFKPRGTDTMPAMLTPGEYIVKKSRVDDVGVGAMDSFNNGMLSVADLMRRSKKNKSEGSGMGASYFDGGGLASSTQSHMVSSAQNFKSASSAASDNSMNFGDIIIQNPKRETAEDSIATALRKVSQLPGRRRPNARLEPADD